MDGFSIGSADVLHPVILWGDRHLQAISSVFPAAGSHGSNLVGCQVHPPLNVTNPVVLEGLGDELALSEAPCIHQFRSGAHSSEVDGGCRHVGGEVLYAST